MRFKILSRLTAMIFLMGFAVTLSAQTETKEVDALKEGVAKQQAKEFQEAVGITGVIITRMDSTAKAGGALTACAETKASVYFIETGEKINDIEEFNPKSFLSRLLGMGDLQTLIEKIKSVTKEDEQERIQKRLEEGKLSLNDVIEQVKSMNSLGGFEKIKSMVPGLGGAKIPEGTLENQQEKISK